MYILKISSWIFFSKKTFLYPSSFIGFYLVSGFLTSEIRIFLSYGPARKERQISITIVNRASEVRYTI